MPSSCAVWRRVHSRWSSSRPWAQTLPPGITQVRSVEGIDEYRLANRRSAAGARRSQAQHHGQPHLPRRLAPGEHRRDRHGAPAGTHMLFKVRPKHPQVWAEFTASAAWRPTAAPSYDRTNYTASFSANADNLRGTWLAGRCHGQQPQSRAPTWFRDDGGAQRDGKRRKQPQPHPDAAAHDGGDVRLAPLRPLGHRSARSMSKTSTSRAQQAFYRLYLPAGQRHAHRLGAASTPPRCRPVGGRQLLASSPSPRASCRRCKYRWTWRRTASARSQRAAAAAPLPHGRVPSCREAPRPISPRWNCWPRCWRHGRPAAGVWSNPACVQQLRLAWSLADLAVR